MILKFSFTLLFVFAFGVIYSQADELLKKGDMAFSRGDYLESIEHYSKAIETDPTNLNAHIQRGLALSITKEYAKSVTDFTAVLDERPELTSVRNSRGSAYLKLKDYDKAIADFNDVLSNDPENQEAYNNRGWCKKYKGDDEGACKDWKTSKKLGNGEAKIILKNNGC
ncbi:MAG: tetratricopeptide repeat protein [Vicingaceae bacterium]